MVADVPSGAEAGFQAYESAVLPLLPRHGGRLDRRLRTGDALAEVHIVSFASQEGFDSYLAAPERQSHRELLDGLDIAQRVLLVNDVLTPRTAGAVARLGDQGRRSGCHRSGWVAATPQGPWRADRGRVGRRGRALGAEDAGPHELQHPVRDTAPAAPSAVRHPLRRRLEARR